MERFSELTLAAPIQERLQKYGFATPTPVQAQAIPHALAGVDVLATAQTGTGKTLAFLLPILQQLHTEAAVAAKESSAVVALVLVPTRELAMQVAEQYDQLRGGQPAAALVTGGLSEGPQLQALRGVAAFQRGFRNRVPRGSGFGAPAVRPRARVVIATPGRLQDFLNRKLVTFENLRVLVLDEADRMCDMGFMPAIRAIVAALPAQRQTLCFSATLEEQVVSLVDQHMKAPVRVAIGSTLKPAENVHMRAIEVTAGDKHEALMELLRQDTGRSLIFARTKHGTERLAQRLNASGVGAASIHGDRSQSQRSAALSQFQQGRVRVLVATDVVARGIHVENIAHVINFDLPEAPEDFIHRIGRTGRAGASGLASSLFQQGERQHLSRLERRLGIRMEWRQTDEARKTVAPPKREFVSRSARASQGRSSHPDSAFGREQRAGRPHRPRRQGDAPRQGLSEIRREVQPRREHWEKQSELAARGLEAQASELRRQQGLRTSELAPPQFQKAPKQRFWKKNFSNAAGSGRETPWSALGARAEERRGGASKGAQRGGADSRTDASLRGEKRGNKPLPAGERRRIPARPGSTPKLAGRSHEPRPAATRTAVPFWVAATEVKKKRKPKPRTSVE